MLPKRFQRRINLLSIFVILVILISLASLAIGFAQNSLLEQWKKQITAEAQALAVQAALGIKAGQPYSALNTLSNAYAQERGYSLTVLLPGGTIASQPSDPGLQIINPGTIPETLSALSGQGSANLRANPANKPNSIFIGEPVLQNGETVGAVLLVAPTSEVNASIFTIKQGILFAAAAVFVAAVFIVIMANRILFRPFRELSKKMLLQYSGKDEIFERTHQVDEVHQLDRAYEQLRSDLSRETTSLQAGENTLEKILENMTDSILIIDSDGIIQVINPAACSLFNISEAQACGHSIYNVVRYHQLVDLWKETLSSGKQHSTTLEIGPSYRFIQGIASPLQTEGLPPRYLMVFQDLTRMRRLENVRRDFVSNVSHELRTPLASIKALAETLSEGAIEDPPAAQRFLTRMENEIDNMTQIVQELLELSRIESGKVPFEMEAVNPCQLIQTAVERMQLQAERVHLNLTMQCSAELPNVNADPNRIGQVLINLLHNAIKFTPPGGSILASARDENDRIIFMIKDSGAGMEPQILERIFERFYKADRARSSEGTGLGLSIARHLVEAHGGQIWAESQVGQGSTFYFSLPKF